MAQQQRNNMGKLWLAAAQGHPRDGDAVPTGRSEGGAAKQVPDSRARRCDVRNQLINTTSSHAAGGVACARAVQHRPRIKWTARRHTLPTRSSNTLACTLAPTHPHTHTTQVGWPPSSKPRRRRLEIKCWVATPYGRTTGRRRGTMIGKQVSDGRTHSVAGCRAEPEGRRKRWREKHKNGGRSLSCG